MKTTCARSVVLVSVAMVLVSCDKKEAEPKAEPKPAPVSAPANTPASTPPSAPANSAPATPPASTPASTPASGPLTYEETATAEMSGKVEALDTKTRWITLRDPSGEVSKFQVGPQVQRLDEVKVGDEVKVDYAVAIEAELRAPTAEEAAKPIAITEITGRSPQGSTPAGEMARRVRVVTTVASVDLEKMLVTLKGPMGNTIAVRGKNPDNVKKLKVGDTIVVSYVEMAAVSLVKATAKP